MTIFERLINDHDKVRSLMDTIEKLDETDIDGRQKCLESLKKELAAHTEAEETVVYPVLLTHPTLEDHVREGVEEHRLTRLLLGELDSLQLNASQWHPKFKALKDLTQHHLKEEENDIFPEARKLVPKEEQKLLGTEFEKRKAEILKSPTEISESIHEHPLEVPPELDVDESKIGA